MKNRSRVVIYSKDHCPYCENAFSLLDSKGIEYTVKKITEGPIVMREFIKDTNGAKTVPQILIDGRLVGGFSDLSALNNSGGLDSLL